MFGASSGGFFARSGIGPFCHLRYAPFHKRNSLALGERLLAR
jgi:hypothetical protein